MYAKAEKRKEKQCEQDPSNKPSTQRKHFVTFIYIYTLQKKKKEKKKDFLPKPSK